MSGNSSCSSMPHPVIEHDYSMAICNESGVLAPGKDILINEKFGRQEEVTNTRPLSSNSKPSLEGINEDLGLLPFRQSLREGHDSDSSETTAPYDDKTMQDVQVIDVTLADCEEAVESSQKTKEHIQLNIVEETDLAEIRLAQGTVEVELIVESFSADVEGEQYHDITFVDMDSEDVDSTAPGDAFEKLDDDPADCESPVMSEQIISENNMVHSGNLADTAQGMNSNASHVRINNNHQEGEVDVSSHSLELARSREPEDCQILAAPGSDIHQGFIENQHIPLLVSYEYLDEEEKRLYNAARRNKLLAFPLENERKRIARDREYHKKILATRQADLLRKSKALEETVELLGSNSCEIIKINEERSQLIEAASQAKVKFLEIRIELTALQHEISKDQLQLAINPGMDSIRAKLAEHEVTLAKYHDEISLLEKLKRDNTETVELLANKAKKRSHDEVILRRKIEELEVQHHASLKLVEEAQVKFDDVTRKLNKLDKQYKMSIVQFMLLETRMVAVQTCRKQKKLQDKILMMLEDMCEPRREGGLVPQSTSSP